MERFGIVPSIFLPQIPRIRNRLPRDQFNLERINPILYIFLPQTEMEGMDGAWAGEIAVTRMRSGTGERFIARDQHRGSRPLHGSFAIFVSGRSINIAVIFLSIYHKFITKNGLDVARISSCQTADTTKHRWSSGEAT